MIAAPVDRFLRTYMARQPRRGPIVVSGLVWFGVVVAAALGASLAGSVVLAAVFGPFAALAALQAAVAWRQARQAVNALVAALGAGVLPFAALAGNRILGIVVIAWAVAALLMGRDVRPGSVDAGAVAANLPIAGATLRVGLPLGLLGASLIGVERTSWLSLALLIGIVCVYDSGHYLIGSTSRSRWAGVGAGLAGNVVVLFVAAALNPHPFEANRAAYTVTAIAALSCPLGQWLGSFMLPNALAKAPALRRLDSWLVAGPLFWAAAAVGS